MVLLSVMLAVPDIRNSDLLCRNSAVPVTTSGCGRTVTVATSVIPCGFDTTSWKISGSLLDGIVKVGFAEVAPLSVTGVPPICDQLYLVAPIEAEPSRVTVDPCSTDWSLPALAAGGAISFTVTVTSAAEGPPGPFAVKLKVKTCAADGATKVGLHHIAPDT